MTPEMADRYEADEYERAARVSAYLERELEEIPVGEYRPDDRPVRSIFEEVRS